MLWIKAFHIIAVVCWFAMIFYLPRLFVYHASADDQISNERFKIMERKLYRGIGTPSMIATIALGFWTASYAWEYYINSTWFILKLSLVALLVAYHFWCGHHVKRFRDNKNTKSHIYFRYFNELPVAALVAIVILVVVKQPT